jgi:phosphoglycolate phosphatase-like HAD superfamily hydrolase
LGGFEVNYQGVLFDLDNTLVDRAGAVVRIAHALYDAEPAIRANTPRDAAVDRIVDFDADGLGGGRKVLMERVQEEWPERSTAAARSWSPGTGRGT